MNKEVESFLKKYNIKSLSDLNFAIKTYKSELKPETIYIAAELLNPNKENMAAYYTDKMICEEIIKELPKFEEKEHITVLEPSVGAGAFLPFIAETYKDKKCLEVSIIDIDKEELKLAELIFETYFREKYKNVAIRYINDDYLQYVIRNKKFDLVIGNPPYFKLKPKDKNFVIYKKSSSLTKTTNMFALFLDKALKDGSYVSLVIPKSLLNAPEYCELREKISHLNILSIIDFGENGFKGVKIETINLIICTGKAPSQTKIQSVPKNINIIQEQDYITDIKFPTWILYRNQLFDEYANTLQLGMFKAFRDRQLTSKNSKKSGKFRILRSRNIETNNIKNIFSYDLYTDDLSKIAIAKYLNMPNIVMIPNLSYSPRACFLPPNCVADGSVALLETSKKLTEKDLEIFETKEFRDYYKIARNYGTRSLNIDSNSVFYFGIRRKK